MLLTEKMKEDIFSPSEKAIINYMLEQQELMQDKTTKQIAEDTFTHPSTVIRIAKKLGYNGWIELKDHFLKEVEYLNRHFTDVDANFPFHEHDHLLNIANKMAILHQTTIKDTLSLLNYDDLQKATSLLDQAEEIKIFGINNNLILCHDFKAHMNRIGKRVSICSVDSEFEAASSNSQTVAILISYSGESLVSKNILPLLQRRKTPIIALTSIGDNTLSKHADCVFHITTREKLYSKIGSFSTNNSISFLLDVLYSCVFSKEYQQNLEYKIQISERYDHRKSTNKVMQEE
ncbi:SIS domain-containing protein [Ornithinibacillus sp. L9]|uniref:SIS domain-containing protein n=1 Tax=Ornithinibacillus caprae TaxID=2678566 RepID=A0A6N8FE44_9BACI|nr:MurR/RpiR family transcriptional regulator [Ornithinibacillus caprae]MUK87471.1 SIS domain-containing protein [Ornithinibacillus caprae]